MDANGNVISPASNEINFTHSSGNKKYETILTAEQAAEYALDKVFPDWRPEEIAAQTKYATDENLEGNVYLVNGKIYSGKLPEGNLKVRKANGRGGFGPEVETSVAGIIEVGDDNVKIVDTRYYNLHGIRVDNATNGIFIKVDTYDNGKTAASKVVR